MKSLEMFYMFRRLIPNGAEKELVVVWINEQLTGRMIEISNCCAVYDVISNPQPITCPQLL